MQRGYRDLACPSRLTIMQVLDVDWFKAKGLLDEDANKVSKAFNLGLL